MKNTGILLLTFCMFSGCELVVDVEVPFDQPQLTLNSVINPDSLWKARVTRNRHVLDEQPFQEINNAQVIVYENGVPIDTLTSTGSGFYQSDNKKPETGK